MFVPEDGTGLPDSNSYVSVQDADAYFGDRGNTSWATTQEEKEVALVRATDYVDGRFGLQFIGEKATDTQSLAWPRTNTPFTGIPRQLLRACCEYAVRALGAELAPDPEVTASGLTTVVTSEEVGPLKTSYAVAQKGFGSSVELFRPYPSADMLLRGLLNVSNRVIR